MLYDSHAHLCDDRFDKDREAVLADIPNHGIGRVMEIVCAIEDVPRALDITSRYDYIRVGVGVHPHIAGMFDTVRHLPEIERILLDEPKVLVLGEIGLDYHYDFAPRDAQRACFDAQLELAYLLDKPVSIHVRESFGDAIEIMRTRHRTGRMPRGVMHCFSGSAETMRECLALGLYISFSGSVTFKNANKLLDAAAAVPEDKLLIETDSPYLSPVPYRGRRNDPRLVGATAARLAGLRGNTPEYIEKITWDNAMRLYGD